MTDEDVPVVRVVTVLVRRRRWIVGTALVAVAVAVGWAFLKGPSYTSASSFIAQSRRPQAALAGFASQLGISVPGAEASQSPQFYAEFVRGRRVLGAVADTRFAAVGGGGADLATLLGVGTEDSARGRERVIDDLLNRVVASANTRTGVVRVTTRMTTPELAQAVNVRLLDLLNDFNLRTRQSQASAERSFTERRLTESKEELRAAEDELRLFLQRNRDYRSSPQLSLSAERLQREVDVRQRIVSTLAEAHEQARIEEVRDTPVITVVEQAEVPVRPDSRGLIPLLALALVGGLAIGCVAVLIGEGVGSLLRSDDPWAAELRDELAATPGLGRVVRRNR